MVQLLNLLRTHPQFHTWNAAAATLSSADASAGCVLGITSASKYLIADAGIVNARLIRNGLPGLIFTFFVTGPRRIVSDASTVWSEDAESVIFTVPAAVA